jgi:hypothetical protein
VGGVGGKIPDGWAVLLEMNDPVDTEAMLADALKLTADAPEAWIAAAALIPSTLGDLAAIERLASDAAFRARFEQDAPGAVADVGLEPTATVIAALREQLAGR